MVSWLRRQLANGPLVCPALATVACVGIADRFSWWWVCLFSSVLLLSFLSRPKVWLLTLVLGFFAGGLHHMSLASQSAAEELHGNWWSGKMMVVGEELYGRVLLRCSDGEYEGQSVQAWLGRGDYSLLIGDKIFVEGRMIAPREALNPDEFPEREWLHRKGISSVLVVSYLENVGGSSAGFSLARTASSARSWIKNRLLLGVDPESDAAKIVCAMVLGERPKYGEGLLDVFRKSGAIHVFAVSGLHVMMVGSIIGAILGSFGCSRKLWVPAVILTMFFYALVTGMRPPAMRATIMGAVLLSAWLVQRRIVLANSVALGAIIALLWDGHMLFLAGFQLSFSVLVAIALLSGCFRHFFTWVGYMDPFLPRSLYSRSQSISLWLRRKIEGGLVVGSCAWCGSSPLTWWHFGLLTPISILVSLPMVLLLYLILIVSFLSLSLGALVPSAGEGLNRCAGLLAGRAQSLANIGAAVPGGHYVGKPWSDGERVVVYALAEGEAAVYIGVGGGVMLDVGSERGFRRSVLPSLQRKGARLDSLVLSHADTQHCDAVVELLSHFQIKQALVPELYSGSRSFRQGVQALQESGTRVIVASGRSDLALSSSAKIEVLYAADSMTGKGVADDRCLVLRLHWRGQRILFLNDAGYRFEQWVEKNAVDVSADVLVIGKHAQDYSCGIDFVGKVNPRLLVAQRSAVQSERWLEALQEKGVEVKILEESGAVTLNIVENKLRIECFATGE